MMVTREEFLAIVSHDLRTPLSVIAVSAAMIAERVAAETAAADLVRAVERIQRSADQMGRMLSDLLDATRFEHGQFRLSPRMGDVIGVVKECAGAFDALARSHGVSLHVDVPDARVRARFDRDRILQVISNLVRNALQFTGSGGVITLRVIPQASPSSSRFPRAARTSTNWTRRQACCGWIACCTAPCTTRPTTASFRGRSATTAIRSTCSCWARSRCTR